MRFEPINRFWAEPTKAELVEANARLKSWMLALAIMAVSGWALFLWSLIGRVAQ